MVVDVMSTGFEVVTRDTFFITSRARQILSNNLKLKVYNQDEIFKAEQDLNMLFECAHEHFDACIAQGEARLRESGFDIGGMQNPRQNYQTITATQYVTQYIDLLAKADYYLSIVEYLWIVGELADDPGESMRVKLNTEREARKQLFGITRASTQYYNNLRRICNGVIELRHKARAEQAERDRKLAAEKKAQSEGQEQPRAAKREKRKSQTPQEQVMAQPGTEYPQNEPAEKAAA
jgi:hypothetical protein